MQGTAAEITEQRRIADYEANPIVKTLRELLLQGDGTWTGHAQKLMELGQHYTHTELAPSSQALAKALVELEPLLWERDAIKHWLKPNPGGGKNTLSRCIAQTIQSRTRMQFNWNAFNSKNRDFREFRDI